MEISNICETHSVSVVRSSIMDTSWDVSKDEVYLETLEAYVVWDVCGL